MPKYIKLPTIGKILKEEFIEAFEINQNYLAEKINVPAGRISQIINGKRAITADTDLRLTKFFNLSEGYFLRIQTDIELKETIRNNEEIAKIIPFNPKARKQAQRCGKNPSNGKSVKSSVNKKAFA